MFLEEDSVFLFSYEYGTSFFSKLVFLLYLRIFLLLLIIVINNYNNEAVENNKAEKSDFGRFASK